MRLHRFYSRLHDKYYIIRDQLSKEVAESTLYIVQNRTRSRHLFEVYRIYADMEAELQGRLAILDLILVNE